LMQIMKRACKLSFLLIFSFILCTAFSIETENDFTENIQLGNDTSDCAIFFQYVKNLTVPNATINHDITQPANLSADAAIFMELSGHSINDLGMYKQCRAASPRNYFLMEITTASVNVPDGSFGLYTGLCLPTYCDKAYLDNQTQSVIQIINLFPVKYLSKVNVIYIDPKDPAYHVHRGPMYILTIVVLALLIILSLLGLWLAKYTKEDPKASPLKGSTTRAAIGINDASFKTDDLNAALLPQEKLSLIRLYFKYHPKVAKFIQCFDLHANIRQLFKHEKDARMDTSLNVLDGIRTICFIGIIFAHTFLNSTMSKNELSVANFATDPNMLLALTAFFSVDVFFLLSGFLQGFQLLTKLKKTPVSIKAYLQLLRHRWMRLAPTYLVAILIYWKLTVTFNTGPLWYQYSNRAQQCGDSWWKNILFLDNVLNTGSQYYCFNWGWYLACDFQMFLVAPFVCWVYVKNKVRAHNILWLLAMLSFIAGFWGASDVNFKYSNPPAQGTGNFWASFYSNTLVRMSSYIIGIFLGTQYRGFKSGETDNFFAILHKKENLSYATSLIGFALVNFVLWFPRVIQTGTQWSDGFNYFWQVIDRPLLAGGLFLGVTPCILGYIKPLKRFLSSHFFVVISRISYCGYLVQLMIILITLKSQTAFLGFSYASKRNLVIAFIVLSVVLGALLHLFVEKPIGNLDSKFFAPNRNPSLVNASPESKSNKKRSFVANDSKIIAKENINGKHA